VWRWINGKESDMKTLLYTAITISVTAWLGLWAQTMTGIYFVDWQTHVLMLIWLPTSAIGMGVALCIEDAANG